MFGRIFSPRSNLDEFDLAKLTYLVIKPMNHYYPENFFKKRRNESLFFYIYLSKYKETFSFLAAGKKFSNVCIAFLIMEKIKQCKRKKVRHS